MFVVSDFLATGCKSAIGSWSCLAALAPVRKSLSLRDAVPASSALCVHVSLRTSNSSLDIVSPSFIATMICIKALFYLFSLSKCVRESV